MRILTASHWLSLFALLLASQASGQQFTMQLSLGGQQVEGGPVAWTDERVFLLARDGKLWDFAPSEADSFRQTSERFQPLSHHELRGRLMREFGRRFDVSGAGQYLVVHPAGERDRWAPRFDELYRSFVRFFAVRGIHPQRPQFPLIAVVFSTQSEFHQYARQAGDAVGPGVLGYYSTQSNRILLYDVTGGESDDEADWAENAATIIHEAAHQVAFNTGVHSRYSPPPRWLAEGLGTLFEAPGVWNSRLYPHLPDRLNRGRLDSFQRRLEQRKQGWLMELVSSDRLFGQDAAAAYAEAWALTFYLVENEPRRYSHYLQRTAARPAFTPYRSPERLQDFADVFGADLPMLEARMLRFIQTLK